MIQPKPLCLLSITQGFTSSMISTLLLVHSQPESIGSNHIIFDYTRMRIVGSCNGLLCLKPRPSHDRSFYICNPSMRTFKEFIDLDPPLLSSDYVAGLCYDVKKDDYKVVMAHIYGEDTFIYSLKSNLWQRSTQKQRPKDCFDCFSSFSYSKSVF